MPWLTQYAPFFRPITSFIRRKEGGKFGVATLAGPGLNTPELTETVCLGHDVFAR